MQGSICGVRERRLGEALSWTSTGSACAAPMQGKRSPMHSKHTDRPNLRVPGAGGHMEAGKLVVQAAVAPVGGQRLDDSVHHLDARRPAGNQCIEGVVVGRGVQ